ncbi:hypothetical protein GCM10022381_21830 [Leifsonia kafniensis]|uniref:Sialate O-acetylesterase domain-containing protein n=1 Tax=Leifsonia kafniensis TaxID=475957 RepID=A0ABP7KLA6_9MICO
MIDAALARRTMRLLLLSTLTGALIATPFTAPALAAGTASSTSCDAAAAADGQQPVLQLPIAPNAMWPGRTPDYSFSALDAVDNGFDRVGYCLETTAGSGKQWAWAGMDAFTTDPGLLGLHTIPGQASQQRVTGLDVASNVATVATGTSMTGWLEHWPNTYETYRSGQVYGATSDRYDADDQPTVGWYGSFQVHRVNEEPGSTETASTVMALNGFTSEGTLDIGFGNAPQGGAAHPDWTFAENANSFTSRTLTVYARPAVVSLTSAPQDRQLIARDAENGANVAIAGTADAAVDTVRLSVTSEGETSSTSQSGSTFSFDTRITAGFHDYDFLLEAQVDGVWRTVGQWTHVVSGDAFVIQGQSNSESAAWESGSDSSTGNQSPWVRTYGTTSWNSDTSRGTRAWEYAYGDMTSGNKSQVTNAGMVGQWGMRMGGVLSQQLQVPVAIINGAHGGQPIHVFQRNDANPDDITTNYGRLRQRLEAAGLLRDVKAVFWYQGESDYGDTSRHIDGFTSLLEDWRSEFGSNLEGGSRYYAFQIRTSCSGDGNAARGQDIVLREAQRNLSRTQNVTVLSPTGASVHDGCHFGYEGGYKTFGEQAAAVLLRDLYDGPSAGVAAPDPIAAAASSASSAEFTIQLDSATDPLIVDTNILSTGDFVVNGSSASITNVAYREGGKLLVTLNGPVGNAATVTYLSHYGAGPMIRTSSGVGLLAFNRVPVAVGTLAPSLVEAVPGGVAGVEYSAPLGAHGVDAARYSLTEGSLPEGFVLDRVSGVLSGVSNTAGSSAFTVRMDSAAGSISKAYSFEIAAAPVSTVSVSADSMTSTVGSFVKITVSGADSFGNNLGDLTDRAVLSSDQPGDVVSGSRVTFARAGTHVITATVGGVSGSVSIEVAPTPTVKSTVSFDSQGGSTVAPIVTTSGSAIAAPVAPKRTGYTFAGWYTKATGGSAWKFTNTVTTDVTLYAHWTVQKRTVQFNAQGGSKVAAVSTNYNTVIKAPKSPTRTGYTFSGWYTKATGGSKWNFTATVTSSATAYAHWTVQKRTVTFNTQGGSKVAAVSTNYNTAIKAPKAPTRSGYTFAGWYTKATGGSKWKFSSKVTANATAYAHWTVQKRTVTFNAQGGSKVAAVSTNYNTAIKAPKSPTRSGYVFKGWYTKATGGTAWKFSSKVTANATAYAHWAKK